MSTQTFIVRLESRLARRVRQFFGAGAHGYASLDELFEVALENQLGAEASRSASEGDADDGALVGEPAQVSTTKLESAMPSPAPMKIRQVAEELGRLQALLQRPGVSAALPVAEEGSRVGVLSAFTNRLSPVKVAARILANISVTEGSWPETARFREESAKAARYLGKRLQEADANPAVRRSVAYPTGVDAEKAKTRFANSFTLTEVDGGGAGPMVLLGLANVVNGKAMLTRAGWRLAAAPSPLMDGSDGVTLSPPEAEILRAQIRQSPDEILAVREFLKLVLQSRGKQELLDELLGEDHPQWSKEFLVAHRSALLGRLSDLSVLEVTGRGLTAMISLLPNATQLNTDAPRLHVS